MTKLCECGCGQPAPVAKKSYPSRALKIGEARRFIIGHNSLKHGGRVLSSGKSRAYISYRAAKRRCENINDTVHWKDYGGRGIRFLFTSFEQFFAELGPRPDRTTLDRFPNNDGNYERGNVRWATTVEQQRNKRRSVFVSKTITLERVRSWKKY